MADEDRVPPLSQRTPGASSGHRPAAQVSPPVLPDLLIRRLRVALAAEARRAARAQSGGELVGRARAAGRLTTRPDPAGPAWPTAAVDDVTQPLPAIGPLVAATLLDTAASSADAGSTAARAGPRTPEDTGQRMPPAEVAAALDRAAEPDLPAARQPPSTSSRHLRVAGVIAAVVLLLGAGSAAVLLSRNNSDGPGHGTSASGSTALQQALSWITGQVSRTVPVACDPVTCQLLASGGFPGGDLVQLGPGRSMPPSGIVVATPAVQRDYGARLGTVLAPGIIASFGAGPELIDVRMIAPHGAAAFTRAAAAGVRTRQQSAAQLLKSGRIQASPTARSQLTAGRVDARLMVTLINIARQARVYVAAFADSGPGAGAGSPLRAAYVGLGPGPVQSSVPRLASIVALVRAQPPPYRPVTATVASFSGRTVLLIGFPAPSPLRLLGPS